MLRRYFISKVIEQMVNAVARLLKIDYEKETEKFLDEFDSLLDTYFQISPEELVKLVETDEQRDALLLDEKLKNFQLRLFVHSGLAYMLKSEKEKATNCLKIIERIQHEHSDVFEFPSVDTLKIEEEIEELKQKINK